MIPLSFDNFDCCGGRYATTIHSVPFPFERCCAIVINFSTRIYFNSNENNGDTDAGYGFALLCIVIRDSALKRFTENSNMITARGGKSVGRMRVGAILILPFLLPPFFTWLLSFASIMVHCKKINIIYCRRRKCIYKCVAGAIYLYEIRYQLFEAHKIRLKFVKIYGTCQIVTCDTHPHALNVFRFVDISQVCSLFRISPFRIEIG